jgi:hypothetical protein
VIRFVVKGSTDRTEKFLRAIINADIYRGVERIAKEGVSALASATPVESGLASNSWGLDITHSRSSLTIAWTNTDIENGFPVAIMLQFGHGTGTGGYVQGVDYINPAIRPIFDRIANEVWKVVTSA